MKYTSFKIKERIIFAPDKELKATLNKRLSELKAINRELNTPLILQPCYTGCYEISTFGHRNGLKRFLRGHIKTRIFIIIDFVHAFHQITRDMIALVFPQITRGFFDICFVELGGKQVIPI